MQILECTTELVKKMHDAGKMVSVWVDAGIPDVYKEDEDFYKKVYDLGIDMLTTDHCLKAQSVISNYHKQKYAEIKTKKYQCK